MDPTDLDKMFGDEIINSSYMQIAVIKMTNKYFRDISWHGIKIPHFELIVTKASRFGAPDDDLKDPVEFINEVMKLMPRRLTPEIKMNYCEMIANFKKQCNEKNIGRPFFRLHMHNQKRGEIKKKWTTDLRKTSTYMKSQTTPSSKLTSSDTQKKRNDNCNSESTRSSILPKRTQRMAVDSKKMGRVAWADMVEDVTNDETINDTSTILNLYRGMRLTKEETEDLIEMFEFMSLESEANHWRAKLDT